MFSKKKRFRKSLVMCICLLMTLGLLSACNESNAPTASSSSNPKLKATTLKLLMPDDGVKDYDNVLKAVEKKLNADGLNFKLEVTTLPYDNYYDKLYLTVASKEDYDIAWVHGNQIAGYIAKGVLAPLNEPLKNFGPDLVKNTPDYVFQGVTTNGNIYAVPRVVPVANNDWMTVIRADLRKKYGLPPITTLDQYLTYLKDVKQNEPGMIPSETGFRELLRWYAPTYYIMESGAWVDLTDPTLTVKNMYESEIYKQICDKIYELTQEGLRIKDRASINNDVTSAFDAGKLAAVNSNIFWPTEQIDTIKANIPNAEIENVFFNPSKPKYIQIPDDNSMAVFSTSKHVNESVAFINWIKHSQENYDLISYGVKGVNYTLKDNAVSFEGIPQDKQYVGQFWMWTDLRFNRYSGNLDKDYINVINNWDKGAVISPLSGLLFDKSVYKDLQANKNTVMAQYNAPMEDGQIRYDDKKDEMLAKMKAAGNDTIIAELQKQINAYIASKKK